MVRAGHPALCGLFRQLRHQSCKELALASPLQPCVQGNRQIRPALIPLLPIALQLQAPLIHCRMQRQPRLSPDQGLRSYEYRNTTIRAGFQNLCFKNSANCILGCIDRHRAGNALHRRIGILQTIPGQCANDTLTRLEVTRLVQLDHTGNRSC